MHVNFLLPSVHAMISLSVGLRWRVPVAPAFQAAGAPQHTCAWDVDVLCASFIWHASHFLARILRTGTCLADLRDQSRNSCAVLWTHVRV